MAVSVVNEGFRGAAPRATGVLHAPAGAALAVARERRGAGR